MHDARSDGLPPRLAALAEAVPPGSRVADVGSDHGRLPLWLAESGRAAYCIATEASPELLARVQRPPASAPWGGRIAYRSGIGLAALLPEDRIDTAVLAGLGGRAIASLLRFPLAGLRRIVLQPRSDEALLRAWLSDHGWRPVVETLTESRGRAHLTIAAERGEDGDLYRHPTLDRDDLLAAGPLLMCDPPPELARVWQRQLERWTGLAGRSARAEREVARAQRVLAAISPRGE